MIHVVTGPPCAGKSTFVAENAAEGDAIVDFDRLAKAFGSPAHHDTPGALRRVVAAARHAAISQILMGRVENAWIIDTDPRPSALADYRRAGAKFHIIDPGLAACLERAVSDERPEWTPDQIRRWYRLNKRTQR